VSKKGGRGRIALGRDILNVIVNPVQMHEQGHALWQQGQSDQAIELATQAVKGMRDQPAAFGQYLPVALTNLGFYYSSTKRWREALACYSEGLDLKIKSEGSGNPSCARTMLHVARCHAALGETGAAAEYYRRSIEIFEAHPDSAPTFQIAAIRGLAWLLADEGRGKDALPILRKGMRLVGALVRAGNRELDATLREFCHAAFVERDVDSVWSALEEAGGVAAARVYLDGLAQQLVEQSRRRPMAPPMVPDDEEWLSDQRAAGAALSQSDEAATIAAHRAYETAKRKFGARSLAAALSSNLIAVSYQNRKHLEEALPWLIECLEATRASVPHTEPMYARIVGDTALAFIEAKRFTEA